MRHNRAGATLFVLALAVLLAVAAVAPVKAQAPAGIPGFTLVKYVCSTNLSNTGNSVPGACVHAPDANGANVPVIAPGSPVSFLYAVAYSCTTDDPINCPALNPTAVAVADNQLPGVMPPPYGQLTGNGDGQFQYGETWLFVVNNRQAADLASQSLPVPAVSGCGAASDGQGPRPTYQNTASVQSPYSSNTDTGAYCNPPVPTPGPTATPRPKPTPTPAPVPVPEPATLVLFGAGLAAAGSALFQRNRRP